MVAKRNSWRHGVSGSNQAAGNMPRIGIKRGENSIAGNLAGAEMAAAKMYAAASSSSDMA